jgi:hypothetical protein
LVGLALDQRRARTVEQSLRTWANEARSCTHPRSPRASFQALLQDFEGALGRGWGLLAAVEERQVVFDRGLLFAPAGVAGSKGGGLLVDENIGR